MYKFAIAVIAALPVWSSDIAAQEPNDPNEFVQAYAALGELQAQHHELGTLEGSYDVIGRFRFAPSGPWEVFFASVDIESVLEGRFIAEHIRGEQTASWPRPYNGLRIMGFDNYQNNYVYSSMNSFGTAMLHMTGARVDGSHIVLRGPFDNPLAGTTQEWKTVYELVSVDRFVLREYPRDLENQEYLGIEAVYTRQPASSALVGRWDGIYRDEQHMTFEFRGDGTVRWSIESDQFNADYDLRYWVDYSVSPNRLELFGFTDGPLARTEMFGIIAFGENGALRVDFEPGAAGSAGDDVRPMSFTESTLTLTRAR